MTNTLFSRSVAICALLTAFSTGAVQYGTDVADSDYEDYLIKLVTGGESCTSSLVGGSYVVTARHCIFDSSGSDTLNADEVTIYQGTDISTADSTTVGFTVILDAEDFIDDMATVSDVIYQNDVYPLYPTVATYGGLTSQLDTLSASEVMDGDFALIKLDSPVEHMTGKLLAPMYNQGTQESLPTLLEEITFQGWGLIEGDTSTTTLQEMTLTSVREWFNPIGSNTYYDEIEAYADAPCDDDNDGGCMFSGSDRHSFYGVGGQLINTGDSGGPLVYGDSIYAVVSSTDGSDSNPEASFTHFTLLMDNIVNAIDDLVYPSTPGVSVESNSVSSETFTIPVQNFTSSDVALAISLTDTTNLFSLDSSDCPDTLGSSYGCTLEVTFNESGSAITEAQTATIQLNSDESLTITASIEDESDSSTDSSESSSSGGSIGGLSLLLLSLAGGLRRLRS